MTDHPLRSTIEALWDARDAVLATTGGARSTRSKPRWMPGFRQSARAEPTADGWVVNQWLKKAVLLSFRLHDFAPMQGPGGAPVFDKVPMKFAGWGAAAVPGRRLPRRARRGRAPLAPISRLASC